jgi:AraC-like DNA-binding protein
MFVRMRPLAFTRLALAPEFGVEVLSARFYGHVYDRHFHDGYAVGLTLEGHQAFRARGARHVGTPGSVIAFAPGEVHDGEAADDLGFAYHMLYLPEALVRTRLEEAAGRPVPLPAFPDPLLRDRRLAAAVRGATRTLEQPNDRLARDAAINRLILALGKAPTPAPVHAPQAAARLRALLHERLAEPITVAALADEAGMDRFRLSRAFARAYGLPPHAYLLSLRLNQARQRLVAGEPPAAVAAACGFTDQAHLTREFRRRMGLTPGAYRRAVSRGSIGTRAASPLARS